jgi:arginyl-tRNA synthetase
LGELGIQEVDERVKHLSYELVMVPGMSMSSRKGEFISADELVKEGVSRALKEIKDRKLEIEEKEQEEISEAVGIGAIKYNMIKIVPLKPITFKWEEALNFEGDSCPYLQYSHARACRILEKVGVVSAFNVPQLTGEEKAVIKQLSLFPHVVETAANDLKASHIATYLYDLAEAFNRFYYKCPVIESEKELRNFRAYVVHSTKQVLANGLNLLGIKALERM